MRNGFLLFSLCLMAFTSCKQNPVADRIYLNAKIWTGDEANPKAEAIAIKDSVILYVGSDYQPYAGSQTKLIDLQGKMMVPGFIDNHVHFLDGGYFLANINLRDVKSEAGFISVFRHYTDSAKGKSWIQGGNWDHEAWGGELPRASWIDSISGEHPVFINRYDGHMGLANSIALKLAGITKKTPSPPGGEIVKDPITGEPTGILRDGATRLVSNIITGQTEKELDDALARAAAHALSHGFTQVHDMGTYGGWTDMDLFFRSYQKLAETGFFCKEKRLGRRPPALGRTQRFCRRIPGLHHGLVL
jgi:predicted amidohydrolase YtcJ